MSPLLNYKDKNLSTQTCHACSFDMAGFLTTGFFSASTGSWWNILFSDKSKDMHHQTVTL